MMASGGIDSPELEDPPSFKSPGWEHFGFSVDYNDDGQRVVGKRLTVCRHAQRE